MKDITNTQLDNERGWELPPVNLLLLQKKTLLAMLYIYIIEKSRIFAHWYKVIIEMLYTDK